MDMRIPCCRVLGLRSYRQKNGHKEKVNKKRGGVEPNCLLSGVCRMLPVLEERVISSLARMRH